MRTDLFSLAIIFITSAFVSGYALGTYDHSGKDAVMEQYSAWSLQEQQDFILAATNGKDTLKRAIA